MFNFLTNPALDAIQRLSAQLNQRDIRIMSNLQQLKDEIEKNKSLTQSAIDLLNGLHTRLQAAIDSGDQTQVQALADELATSNNDLAAAITANTDPAPAPTADPAPTTA